MTRVLVVDDHVVVRDGLRHVLEAHGFSVVGEAGDGFEAIRAATRLCPDVVVIDVSLPRCDGIAAAREISASVPGVGIVCFSMFDDDGTIAAAAAAGARAFVLKSCPASELMRSVRAVADHADLLAEYRSGCRRARGGPEVSLSRRELEVLELASSGLSTTEIASSLYVSYKTVKNHLASIYVKLGVRGRTEAILAGMRQGLVRAPIAAEGRASARLTGVPDRS